MRRSIIPAAVLAATLALAGCSAMSGSDSVTMSDSGGLPAEQLASPPMAGDTLPDATAADREVVTTGVVTITVDSPADAAADAVRITEAAGGRVDARSETAPINGNQGSATLTLRIPADSLTATLDDIRALGAVQEVSLTAADVTMETQDLDARITALRASVDRLLLLLGQATETDTLITLESAISDRQGELESLEAQRRYYTDRIAMSTITLSLVSEFTAPTAEPDTFLSGLLTGWNAFVAFFAGLLVVLGVLLPWLALAGIITGAILLLLRRRRAPAPARDPGPPAE